MRLIDADAMMERLKCWDTNDPIDKALYNFALNRVIEQPTVEPQWIPCSERLPNHELAIVQYSDGGFDLLQFPTAYRRKDIVAWMPLPKPYKGEES